jgi:ABC-type nitrate/sulfonate/bicarbonate transport system permease component
MTVNWRGAVVPAAILLVWELGGRLGLLPVEAVSTPTDIAIAVAFGLANGTLITATAQTFQAVFGGLLFAAMIGVAFGIIFGLSPILQSIVGPTVAALRPVPPVALIPVALLIFGFGAPLDISIVAFACVWPILIATTDAVRNVEPRLVDLWRGLELARGKRLRRIAIPATILRIGPGLRLAAGIAFAVAVTAEIVVNPRGLGYAMTAAQQQMEPDILYAFVLWTGLVALLFDFLMLALGRRILRC